MGIYTTLEDKWYDALDWLDKYIPITKVTDRIDTVVPSFILFLVLVALIILALLGMLFTGGNQSAQLIVLSQAGVPLEGVSLQVTNGCGGELTLVTDALGKAAFTACSVSLPVTAQKEGYLEYSSDVLLENGKAQISLNPKQLATLSRAFHAEVQDTSGARINGATLTLICIGGSPTALGTQKATGFDFEVPAACTSAQLKASASGYQEQTVNLSKTDERKIITLTAVETKATLIVEASDTRNTPTPAELVLTNTDTKKSETYFTDSQGAKTLTITSGSYTYSASTSNGQFKQGTFTIAAKETQTLSITFTYVDPATVADSNVIYLKIMADANTPIQGATVTLYHDGNVFGTLTSGADGTTTQKVILAGDVSARYYAYVHIIGFESKIVQVQAQSKSAAPQVVSLRKGGAVLKVTTVDDTNALLRNSAVALTHTTSGIVIATLVTDSNGSAQFLSLPSGNYTVDAVDATGKIAAEASVSLSTDERKNITMVLVTGQGTIKFRFFNYSGSVQNPAYSFYQADANGALTKIIDGTAKSGVAETPKLKVGTKVKLIVTDGNYFAFESLVYEVTRTTQQKDIYLRALTDLPNTNPVQMTLDAVYESNPLYGTPQKATRLLPGNTYYFEYATLLNTTSTDAQLLVANFFVGPKDVNTLLATNPISITSAFSIDGAQTLLVTTKTTSTIDPLSQTLVDTAAKQANVRVTTSAPKIIPVVLAIQVDANAVNDVHVYYESFYTGNQSLLYSTDMNIGTAFCFNSNNCPQIAFSNWVQWTTAKGVTTPFTPLGDIPYSLYIGDTYALKTIAQNMTDTLFGDVNLSLSIPRESIDSFTFANDSNRASARINLGPLANSVAITNPLIIKTQAGSAEKVLESIEKISGGLNTLASLNGNGLALRLAVKSKDQLQISTSPTTLYAGTQYPLFLIKTKYAGKSAVPAHWYVEKVDADGNAIAQLYSGTTDANGLQIIGFNATNLSKGDRVRFTAYDDNGALDGTTLLTVTPIYEEPPVIAECLQVTVNNVNVSQQQGYYTRVAKGTAVPVTITSNCDEDRILGVHTDLVASDLQTTVGAHATKVITLTATPPTPMMGAYPVQLLSINGSRYVQLAYFDIDVVDPSSCFDLQQAIFDLKTTGTISSKVINNCFAGRMDNYYPKMDISTKSVSLSYAKPGTPAIVSGTINYMAIGVEGLVEGFSWGQRVKQSNKGPSCDTPTGEVTTLAGDFVYLDKAMEICEASATKYTEYVPKPKVEPDIPETDPSVPFYALPVASQQKIVSQIVSPEGTWSTPTDANLSAAPVTKKAQKASFSIVDNFVQVQADLFTGGAYSAGDLLYGDSAGSPEGGNGTDPLENLESPESAGNSERIMAGDVYGMPLGSEAYAPTVACELQHSLDWVAFERPPGWDGVQERFHSLGEKNYSVAVVDAAENHDCLLKAMPQYNLGSEDSGMFMTLATVGNQTCDWSGFFCTQETCSVDTHYEFHRTVTALAEQIARQSLDFNIVPVEGKVYNIGSYEDPLVPQWTEMKTAHGIAPGERDESENKVLTTNCVTPLGFVPLEVSSSERGPYAMPDPADPTIEYDSDRTYIKLSTSTLPDGFRAFVKNGDIYVEYLGNVKWVQDPNNKDNFVMIHTASDIAGPNIDFNITKVSLQGNEYAILTVQDWVSGTAKQTQQFQVKLSGPANSCFSSDGIDGVTGSNYVPNFLYNWDWNSITMDTCSTSNSDSVYCDATQFTMSLFKRLTKLDDELKKNQQSDFVKNTTFQAYLIKDNYNPAFLSDFKDYFAADFANTPAFFNSTPQSAGYDTFITQNKLSFTEPQSHTTQLPYGGLYNVEINVIPTNPLISSLFDGTNANATIQVTLRPVVQAPNYSPLYELPFDGLVGKKGNTFARSGYGVAVNGAPLRLNTSVTGQAFSGALKNIAVQTTQNISEMQNGKILTLNKDGTLKLLASQPTPVFMTVTGQPGSAQAAYAYSGSNATTVGPKEWKLTNSTMSVNGKCADFTGNNQYLFTDKTLGGDVRGLTWNATKSGTVGLVTTYYTPKDMETPLRITPSPPDSATTKFNSFSYVKNNTSVLLDNYDAQQIDDYDTVNAILNGVASEQICMSKNGTNEVQFWWNPAYTQTLEKQVTQGAGTKCS